MITGILRGSVQSVAFQLLARALGFGAMLVTTRYLGPTGIGWANTAIVVFSFVYQFGDFGLSLYALQVSAKSLNSLWKRRVIIATVEWAAVNVVSFSARVLYPHYGFIEVPIFILSTTNMATSLYFSREVLLKKRLKFARLNTLGLMESTVGSIAQIGLIVLWHMGYIAIVLGPSLGTLIKACVYWTQKSDEPNDNSSENAALNTSERDVTMGREFAMVKVVDYWAGNVDRWAIEIFSGIDGLALYTMSSWLGRVIDVSLSQPIKQVLVPAYATMKDQRSTILDLSRMEFRWTTILTCLWAGLLLVVRDPAVMLFGAQWRNADVPLQIIAICGILAPFINIAGSNMLSLGKPRWVRVYTMLRLSAIALGAWPLIKLWGVTGMAILDLVGEIGVVIPYILLRARHLMDWYQILKEGFVSMTVLALCVPLVRVVFGGAPNPLGRIATFIAIFAIAVGVAGHRTLMRDVKLILGQLMSSGRRGVLDTSVQDSGAP